MRLLVDLLTHLNGDPKVVQVQTEPTAGSAGQTAINGKYALPTPLGMDFPVTNADHILNGGGFVDADSLVSVGFAHLAALHPQFDNVYFNPLLTSDHVGELVLDQSFWFTDRSLDPAVNFFPRFQTGREAGVADNGQMPTHTAILAANGTMTPERPGFIITEAIDIGPYTLDCDDEEVGTDEFMVYWKLYDFDVTHDVAAEAGLLAGTNTPALRYLREVEGVPDDFSVWLTTDEGANWCQVHLLEPIAFCEKTTSVRLAFRNDSSDKIFIASYALLF
jgi:hypothetical protein